MSGASKNAISLNLGKFDAKAFRESLGGIAIDRVASIRDTRIKTLTARILSMPQGTRPHPDTYTSIRERLSHRRDFSNGYTKIVFFKPDDSTTMGDNSGTFVMPTKDADRLIRDARGNPRNLERMLGLKQHALGDNPYRVDFTDNKAVRFPSGNESGANEGWIPGGRTISGIREGVVDKIEPAQYKGKYRLAFGKK